MLSKAHLTNLNLNNYKKDSSYGIESYCIEVPLNDITSVQFFMKIYEAIPKLLVGNRHAQRQTDW
jgi:hypothetical protein